LSFSIPQSAFVTLEIVDVFGNVISTLANETFPAGTHTRDWRAFDENNAKIASGTYIYRLKVNDEVLTGKMSLIK
jgi:flagellar hook assembly protein FlgD